MKKRALAGMVMALILLLVSTAAFSQPKATPTKKLDMQRIQVDKPPQLDIQADPAIESIYASQCPCAQDLASVNAFLMKNMWVTMFNGICPGGKKAEVSATLKVRYFDLKKANWEEKNISFTMPANSRKAVKVVNGNVLVKSSTGITAQIINIKSPVKDCDPSNNIKTVKACMPPPVY